MAEYVDTGFPFGQPATYLALTAAALASVFLVFAQTSGDAQEVDCDVIHRHVVESGELPNFIIDPSTDSVTVTTSRGQCRESTVDWTKRDWNGLGNRVQPAARPQQPQPPPAARQEAPASPPARTASPPAGAEFPARPFETHPAFRKDPAPAEPTVTAPAAQDDMPRRRPPGDCLPLAEFWKPGDVIFNGRTFQIARAFTIDANGDGVVDDVGFRLKSSTGDEADMRYFPRTGSAAAKAIEGLGLADDSVISRLCFGSVDLLAERPPEPSRAEAPPPPQAFRVPDLASEYARREGGAAPGETPAKTGSGFGGTTIWMIGAGGAGLVAVAGAGLFLTRRRWLPAKRGRDDDEKESGDAEAEDGEESKPKAKRSGLSGLFGGKKAAKRKGGEEDEDLE
jgi:hypothetical protein